MMSKLSLGKPRYYVLGVGIWMLLFFLLDFKLTSVKPGAPACKQEGEQLASSPSQESGLEDHNRFANSSAACICESTTTGTDSSAENHKDVVGTELRFNISDEEHLLLHPHPGAGAKDAQGHWGYIHDAKFLSRDPNLHPFTIPDEERDQICAAPGEGPEGDIENYRRLTEGIQILPEPQQNGQPVHDNKLFCAVYTHPGGRDMTKAALETWVHRCDGFLAASTITDAALGIVEIPHGGENYGQYKGVWQKVRSMMTYIYEQYGSEYDYFHITGDDTFLVVENLKAFLHEKRPRYVGSSYAPWWLRDPSTPDPSFDSGWARSQPGFHYPLGGSGYTVSAATLRLLAREILPMCEATVDESPEDYFVGRCLWQAGIRPEPHEDETGADLFMPHGLHWGVLSSKSVSFHYIKTPAFIRRFEKLLYRRNHTDTDCLEP